MLVLGLVHDVALDALDRAVDPRAQRLPLARALAVAVLPVPDAVETLLQLEPALAVVDDVHGGAPSCTEAGEAP